MDRWSAFLSSSRWYGLGGVAWLDAAFGLRSAGAAQNPYPVTVDAYPDGELRLELPVPPPSVAVVGARTDDHRTGRVRSDWLGLLHASCVAARQHGAARVVAVLSEVPCLRQDRPTPGRLELAARDWVVEVLSQPAFDAVVTWQPKPELVELVTGTQVAVPGLDDIASSIVAALPHHAIEAIIAPDGGAVALAAAVAFQARCQVYRMRKHRSGPEDVVSALDGSAPPPSRCLVVDDMYVSGGTLAAAAAALSGGGRRVLAYVGNFRPTGRGRERLDAMLGTGVLEGLLVPGYQLPARHQPGLIAVDTANALRAAVLAAAGVADLAGAATGSRHG